MKIKFIFTMLSLTILTAMNAQHSYAEWYHDIQADHAATNFNNIITDGENVYLNGTYTTAATFQGIELPEDVSTNVILAKLTREGEVIWTTTVHGNSFDAFYDIALDSNGDLLAAGWFSSNEGITVNGEVIISGTGLWVNTSVVAKFSGETGNMIWAKHWQSEEYGSCNAVRLAVDAQDNVYVGGYHNTDFTVDEIEIDYMNEYGNNNFIFKFDADGTTIWGKAFADDIDGNWPRVKTMEANDEGVYYASNITSLL